MVRHIVCFKLKNATPALCQQTRDLILSMRGHVPTAKNVEAHIDQLHSERSFDIMLDVLVDDWDALKLYQQDAYHCNVVKKHMGLVAEKSITLDFQV